MKFLCPNCKAKYRIGPEKMVGRQAAKIRCRKCEYLIQIAYRPNSDEFDVTASPPSVLPPPSVPPPPRMPKTAAVAGQPAMPNPAVPSPAMGSNAPAGGVQWSRPGAFVKDEGSASKKPTAAVPGLPGLGSPKSRGVIDRAGPGNGAGLLSDPPGLARRPLAPLPPPPVPPFGAAGLGGPLSAPSGAPAGVAGQGLGASAPAPSLGSAAASSAAALARSGGSSGGSTQLADQFRESVQAGGAVEDLPQEGWFVGVNGVPLGPIPLADLRELAMAGHIDRRSLVWRDGQPEWRPLGKFQGLARVIDDGVSPPQPRVEAVATSASRPNGANGQVASSPLAAAHVATGFDVPRADAGERPSAWGDLDDDDEDEQPTTVKGRVSVMPSGEASIPMPPPPAGLPPGAPNPFGVTSAQVPSPAPTPNLSPPPTPNRSPAPAPVMSLSPAASEFPAPVSIISAIPDSMGDVEEGLRPRRRSKWYLIAVAIVFAFALGAIVTHLMRASSPDKTSSDSSGSRGLPGAADKGRYDDVELGSEARGRAASAERDREVQPEAITAALRPGNVEGSDDLTTSRAALAPALSVASLSSALGVSGAGLDATAIQRTVRRYSPGVRQNCWQRAIDARPPGVPTSVKLTATITVDAGGRVEGVAVTGTPRGYPSLARCVESAVKSWQFPRSGAQTITNVPFMFMGQ